MIDTKLLEPFNLKFSIYAGNPGYYFISNPYNFNLSTKCEEVDLSKWSVDSVVDVYIQQEYHYKEVRRVYKSPKNSIHLRYEYNPKDFKLKIYWSDFEPNYETNLVIKFYSVAQQREKNLNQLFNETD
jgi:hypothetical protein